MRNRAHRKYSEISSFDNFGDVKQNLRFREELVKSKLRLGYLGIKHELSETDSLWSFAKKLIMPGLAGPVGNLFRRILGEQDS